MKDYNEIRSEVVEMLRSMLPEANVKLETIDVVKMNDIYQYGIVFQEGSLGKTFYINDYISAGKTAIEIADEMLIAFENSVDVPPYHFARELASKQCLDDLAENLFVAVIEITRNKDYLREIPYQEVGDGFAFICQVRHTDASGNGFMSAAITQKLVDANEWSTDELFRIAVRNTLVNDAPLLCTMISALSGDSVNLIDEERSTSSDPLILTNESRIYGAAALFLPGIVDKIHAYIGDDFYAIPSSVHEMIIVPASMGINPEEMSDMCSQTNATMVTEKEILSDHALFFPRK